MSRGWFITEEGNIYTFGQIGLKDTEDKYTPTQIPEFSHIVQVSCGSANHT